MRHLKAEAVILCIVLFFGLSPLVAPTRCPGAELTLDQAVGTALSGNPDLQAAVYRTRSAREKTIQARAGFLPQAQIAARYTRTTNPMWAFGTRLNQESITALDFDPDRLNNPDGINDYSSVVSVTWPVYDSGQTRFGSRQARLGEKASELFVERTRQQVMAGTITAYIGTLMAREYEDVVLQAVETALSHLSLVQSRYNGGFVTKSDLLRARVHIADLKQQLAEARSQTHIAKCRLNMAMGVAGDPDYTLSTPLKAGDPISGSLDSWISAAMSGRADLKHLALQKEIADAEIRKSRAARHPSVNVVGNYEINSEDFSDAGANYTLGAVVSMPLFTGGRISSKIREAEANMKQTEFLIRAMEQQVCGETRQAFFNARSAWERIQVARAAVSQSRESLRIVRDRYNSGLFTITDLLDADAMVQRSMTNHLRAIHDYRAAATRLGLAAGSMGEH